MTNVNQDMREIELKLCMGSACHQKGVNEVLPILEQLLEDSGLAGRVVLKGAFCLGPCVEGIVMQLGERLFTELSPGNIKERFAAEIQPAIRKAFDEE